MESMLFQGTTTQDFSPGEYKHQHSLQAFINSKGKITEADVREFQKQWGPVGASHLIQKTLRSNSSYRFFQQELILQSGAYSDEHLRKTVFILPHCPYVSKRVQDEMTEALNLTLSRLGFAVHVIPYGYRESVSENAHALWQRLRQSLRDDIYLVSFSQGSLEARFLLEQMPDKSEMQKIKGWLNIGGLLFGSIDSPSIKWSPFEQYKRRLLRGSKYWSRSFVLPHDLPLVSYYGFPVDGGVELSESNAKLWGPHDGAVALVDTLRIPGIVCPLEAATHLDLPYLVSPKLVKILQWMIATNNSDSKVNWRLSSQSFE